MDSVTASGHVIEGGGTREAQWQAWPLLHALPEVGLAKLVPAGSRAVVVAPHPDDEVLASGGMLAMLVDCENLVRVVGVTDGDASHPNSLCWTPEKLAALRYAEAMAGLGQLGLNPQSYLRLSLPDGYVQDHHAQLVKLLIQVVHSDDVVLSTWSHDGHPDHEATAAAVAQACAAVQCLHLQSPVWMWHWAAPGDRRVPWTQLRRLALTPDAQRRKRRALLAHASQLTAQDNGAPPVLSSMAVERMLRPFEYFFVPPQFGRVSGLEKGA